MVPDPLIKAYLTKFHNQSTAAEYANLPTSVMERLVRGDRPGYSSRHGYNPEERLEDAIYKKLKRREIDEIMEAWRTGENDRLTAEGEKILAERNGFHIAAILDNVPEQEERPQPSIRVIGMNGQQTEEILLARSSGDLLLGREAEFIPVQPKEKWCPKCGETKPIDDFHRSEKSPDKHHTWCKVCQKIYDDERRKQRKAAAQVTSDEAETIPAAVSTPVQEEPNWQSFNDQLSLAESALVEARLQAYQMFHDTALVSSLESANTMLVQANADLRRKLEAAEKEVQDWIALVDSSEADKLREENTRLFQEAAKAREEKSTILREMARLRAQVAQGRAEG